MNSKTRIEKVKNKVVALNARREAVEENKSASLKRVVEMETRKKLLEKSAVVSQLLADAKRGAINKLFSETVTSALRDTFSNRYKLKLEYGVKNNRSVCEFMLATEDYKGYLPLKMCHGKSVMEIISVVLRIMLVNTLGGDVLVLDEPLSGLEVGRQHVIAEFIRDIAHGFGIQLLMVSHCEALVNRADNIIKIQRETK